MTHTNAESIYSQIVLLPETERDKLYNKMMLNFYQNPEIVAYTTDGVPLTHEQYMKRVNTGIQQCIRGEGISLEDLSKELGYNYADL